MKRRIFLSHTVMMVLALAVLLLISSVVVGQVGSHYAGQAQTEDPPNADAVRELLETWVGSWSELARRLTGLGYQLQVTRNGTEVYSTLNAAQRELLLQSGTAADWTEGQAAQLWNGKALVVGIRRGEDTLVAMSRPDVPELFGQQRPQNEALLLTLLLSGTAAILLIVPLSMVSIRIQVRQIMRPVNSLADAARRVEAGDLSTPVDYRGEDEFVPVCTAFDHMQRHLLEEREKNLRYEQARTDLIAGISHDLRTPLTSVKGYLKGLRDGVANTPEKQLQYLDIAYRKACDMEVLLQRLFYFSRLETGALPLFPVVVDLRDFARVFIQETGGELAQRGGRFVLRGAPAPHPVRLDPEQMTRVLTNVDVPILMVTARSEPVDKVRGLGLGADDYIAKPFDPAELVARVKAHLSRYDRLVGAGGSRPDQLRVGPLTILPRSWKVFKGEREIRMPNREFELLKFLAENPNIVFSKEHLFERIWCCDYVGDSATVTVHIGRIREKIEDDPADPKIIETVWGAGYRLNA